MIIVLCSNVPAVLFPKQIARIDLLRRSQGVRIHASVLFERSLDVSSHCALYKRGAKEASALNALRSAETSRRLLDEDLEN